MSQLAEPSRARIQATLRDYLQVMFRRKWFFLTPLGLLFFLVTTISFYLPPTYRSSSLIMMEEPPVINPLVHMIPRAAFDFPTPEEQLLSLREQMLSWPHLWELIRRLGLDVGIVTREEMEELLMNVHERFSVRLQATNIFELSFEDRDPVRARDGANILPRIFFDAILGARREEAVTAVDFIGEQVERYYGKLAESGRALYEFRRENPMVFPGVQENVNLQMLVQYESQLVEVGLIYEENRREFELLGRQLRGEERIVFTEATRGLNPLLDQLNMQIVAAEMELTNLLVDATEKHPRVIELRSQIMEMKERLARAIEVIVSREALHLDPVHQRLEQRYWELEIHLRDLKARQVKLERLVAEFQRRVDGVPAAERDLAHLARDNMVNERIYAMLLERLESSRISQVEVRERGAEFRIIAPARLPLEPFRPQKGMMAIISFIVGSFLGLGVVFLAEFSDHSLHGREDAKTFLGLPTLGAVPVILTPADLAALKAKQRLAWLLIAGFGVAFLISLIVGLIVVFA